MAIQVLQARLVLDMKIPFSNLNLHDSAILQLDIVLDATRGESLTIWLKYIENYESKTSSPRKLMFVDCREIQLSSHLGFAQGHSIDRGDMMLESNLLTQVRLAWANSGAELSAWKHFYISTHTGSRLDVIAHDFILE